MINTKLNTTNILLKTLQQEPNCTQNYESKTRTFPNWNASWLVVSSWDRIESNREFQLESSSSNPCQASRSQSCSTFRFEWCKAHTAESCSSCPKIHADKRSEWRLSIARQKSVRLSCHSSLRYRIAWYATFHYSNFFVRQCNVLLI